MTLYGRARDCACRYNLYVGTVSGTVQYFVIGQKVCKLMRIPSFLCVVKAAATSTGTNTIALQMMCGGILPVVAASTMTAMTVADILQDTVLQIAVTEVNGIPTAVVINR